MEYIDVEKLIAELRRQKRELELSIQSQGDYGQSCQIVAYENILSLIGSLQQERPEVDLAEEITRFFSKNPIPNEHITDWPLLKNTAIHFYELGRAAKEE